MTDANTLTVVIPYAPAHAEIALRAKASVENQSIPTSVIMVADTHRRGVATARNEGVKQASTPLVAFLDADDVLEPEYAAKMVARWQHRHYVYCDFYFGHKREYRATKDCINARYERRHTVTCLMSVGDFWQVGGFDPTYLKAEDVEFWFRCHSKGVIGLREPNALFHYTSDQPIRRNQMTDRVGYYLNRIYDTYKEVTHMGCCGGDKPAMQVVLGTKQEGDVEVITLWGGNRSFVGKMTGRAYPRNGNRKRAWVALADALAQPALFKIVDGNETVTSDAIVPDVVAEPTVYDDMSRADLFAEVKARIDAPTLTSRTTKAELIAMLVAHDNGGTS